MKNNDNRDYISKNLGIEDDRIIVWYLCLDVSFKNCYEAILEEFKHKLVNHYCNSKKDYIWFCIVIDFIEKDNEIRKWLKEILDKISDWEIKTLIIKNVHI